MFGRSPYGQDDPCDVPRREHPEGPLETLAAARFHNLRMSCCTPLESSLASPSTHCCSKVGCVFWIAVRAMSSSAANASLPTHARLSALGCLDYDLGVPNLYKGFGFLFPIGVLRSRTGESGTRRIFTIPSTDRRWAVTVDASKLSPWHALLVPSRRARHGSGL
jgi:hypothetical protein